MTSVDVKTLSFSDGGASSCMANHIGDNGLQEYRNMLHGRSSNSNDGLLHGDGELPVHLNGDVFDAALRNLDQGLLDDWVLAEDGEVGFGDDLELHPRHLAEQNGELPFDLNEDEDSVQNTQASAQVKTTGHIVFLAVIAGVYEALGDEEESIEDDGPAGLAEAAATPLELSVYVADVLVELKVTVGHTSLGVVVINVEATVVSELEVRAGVLDQIMLTLAGRQESDQKIREETGKVLPSEGRGMEVAATFVIASRGGHGRRRCRR